MTQPHLAVPSTPPCPASVPASLRAAPQARLDWLFRLPQAGQAAQDLKAMVLRYRQVPPK